MSATETILTVAGIGVRFGGLVAVNDVSFSIDRGVVTGLIGPNGAGKTTIVNVLTGFQKPSSGSVHFMGQDITALGPEQRARLGVARTFQAVRLFRGLAVRENLQAYAVGGGASAGEARSRVGELLHRLDLTSFADRGADALPYGVERRVGIARALALSPKILLLDEPAAGLNDSECDDLMSVIREVPSSFDCGVLLIEHNMRVIMGVCDRINVVDFGRKIAEGTPEAVRANQFVRDAYLGEAL